MRVLLIIRVLLGGGAAITDWCRMMPIARERPRRVPEPVCRIEKSLNNIECVSHDSEDTDFTADTLMPGPQLVHVRSHRINFHRDTPLDAR